MCENVQTMLSILQEKSLNWVNMQVFDSEGRLVTGEQTLQVFDFPDSKNVKQYPHGTPGTV